jgi:hypothetical protein
MANGSAQDTRSSRDREATVLLSGEDESARALTDAGIGNSTESEEGYGGLTASAWQRTKALYWENIGLFFVFLAQIFASIVQIWLYLSSVAWRCC